MEQDTKEFLIILLIWSCIFFPLYLLNVDLFGIKFADFTNSFFSCFANILMFNFDCK